MKKLKKILCNNNGFSSIFAVIILLVSMLIFTAVYEYVRLNIIAEGVRDTVQSAVISVVNDNYGNTYPSTRQGYSGGYKTDGETWNVLVTEGDIYGRLDSLLGLKVSSGKHIKLNTGGTEFLIYGMSVDVKNAPFAPNSTSNIQQFTLTTSLTLEVPISFMGDTLLPMKINLVVKSKYVPKF